MKPWISFLFYHPFASKFVSSLKALEKREIVVILSATWPCHCTLIRLWERDFYLAIAEEGAARVNYHTIEMESEYKSTSRWKLYLSPLHRHFAIENTAAVIILLTRLLCHIFSAAVSWDPGSASPKETAAHNWTTFLSFCVCHFFALCWTDQSHNSKVRMTYDFARKGMRCEQWGISGFCCTPHARHRKWAVFVGYERDKRKQMFKWNPQVQVVHMLITMFS